jgi:hypothetical protein
MGNSRLKLFVILSVLMCAVTAAAGQVKMPDELNTNTIEEQFRYVESHTRIYEGFRAIREDIFQKVNGNFLDTLSAEKGRVAELKKLTTALNGRTDSLNILLASTRGSLAEVTATKNKISVLGLGLNKGTYNAIMWTLVAALIVIMAMGFLIFKRNLVILLRTEKDLKELKEEFAAYRQSSRIAREKVEMDLFRANQKLKGM